MGEIIRSFAALNIPASVAEPIGHFIDGLRREITGVRWVRTSHLHLTLKFLGDVDGGDVPALTEALSAAAAGAAPIAISLDGAGAFPPRGRPRVVWLDMAEGADELAALQGRIEKSLEPLGFAKEGRPFRPHLTIGRVKDLRDRAALTSILDRERDRHWGSFRAETVHLMRSELFPTGARYSILREVRLRT